MRATGNVDEMKFKVRWQGKGPEEESWFYHGNISDLQALDDYLETHPELHGLEQTWAAYEESQAGLGVGPTMGVQPIESHFCRDNKLDTSGSASPHPGKLKWKGWVLEDESSDDDGDENKLGSTS
jgi:hypothetical protein